MASSFCDGQCYGSLSFNRHNFDNFGHLHAIKTRKILPLDAFPGPKIALKCVCGRGSAPDPAGGAYSAPPDPLAAFKGPTSKGGGRGGEGRGRGREGREREGGDTVAPPTLKSFPRPWWVPAAQSDHER